MSARAGVCLLLAALSGCRTPEPVPAPPPDRGRLYPTLSPAAACSAAVANSDTRTHVYLVDGADPFGWAAMERLADRVRRGGYPHTTYGQVYDVGGFEREIRETHAANPAARFALIGFSAGTLPVRAAVNRLVRDGVPVAMVGYIGGDYLTDTGYTHPPGVGAVNVTGNGFLLTGRNLFWNGTDLGGGSNVRLEGVAHFDLPKHPRTLAALFVGLGEVSGWSSPPPGVVPARFDSASEGAVTGPSVGPAIR